MQTLYMRSSIKSIVPSWVYPVILMLACLVLYTHTASYSYTELDDSIFIREFEQYNKQDSSFAHSFKRGVFSDSSDTYYRPLLLASFVLDRHLEGKRSQTLHREKDPGDTIAVYHRTNIILHCLAVLLLFALLHLLRLNSTASFLVSVVFAVHPALVQAVAWIPGRNDTLLAMFSFAFLLSSLFTIEKQRYALLPVQFLLLLCALFTKETGIIIAPLAVVILTLLHGMRWNDKRLWYHVPVWGAAVLVWFFVRSSATVQNQDISAGTLVGGFLERLPLIIQYFGKIILPVNLAVVPYQDQTSIVFGLLSLGIVGAIVMWTREIPWRAILTGVVWYIVFLLPALIVPKTLNNETYEHRLYLPIVGILFMLVNTDLVRRFNERRVLLTAVPLCAALFFASYQRTNLFSDKITFWESAVATSPTSAFTTMMLGARYILDPVNPRPQQGSALIRQSYAIDSGAKYINYYMALLLWNDNTTVAAEPFLERELVHNPAWAELYFRLARCAIERGDLLKAKRMLERHFELNPYDEQGANNLLMICVDTGSMFEARRYADRITALGVPVPQALLDKVRNTPVPLK